jgi:hypothetical protein
MFSRFILSVGCLLSLALATAPAFAQTAPGTADVKLHLGPLGLSPSLTLSNLGVDTNVFNTADNPTRDFTIGFVPATGESLRAGVLLLTGSTGVPLTYFQKATNQRSIGFQQSGRADLNLVHFRPYVTAAYSSTYSRPNAEIDARVQQVATNQGVGAVIRLGSRTTFDANYSHGAVTFGSTDGLNVDADIAQLLDRRVTSFNGTFRMALTALTTLAVKSTLEHDRFDFNSVLNNNNLSLIPGLEFRRDARVSGSIYVGVRALRPLSPLVPNFTGVVGSAALSFLARDRTRIDGRFDRNLDYSIDPTTPYFVSTGTSVSLTQLIVGRVDAAVGVGRDLLAYRDEVFAPGVAPVGRTDRTNSFSFGSGYRFRVDARLGFNVSYLRRLSALDGREYTGFQFGGTMKYGF